MIYFPCGPSLVSFLLTIVTVHDAETLLFGRYDAVGALLSCGSFRAYAEIIVEFGGPFIRLRVRDLEAGKLKSLTLRHLFARCADCLLAQVFQSTACNAIHSIEQRTAKWIIAAMDRTGDD